MRRNPSNEKLDDPKTGVLMAMKMPKVPTTLEKPRKISKKVVAAIELLLSGEVKTQRVAAKHVGLNECHLSTALKQPHVQAHIVQRARLQLTAGTLRASSRMMELINANSEHVSFDASKHVLALAGIKPPEQAQIAVSIDLKAGYVIDLSEDGHDPVRIVSPAPAAPKLIEHDESAADMTPKPGERR